MIWVVLYVLAKKRKTLKAVLWALEAERTWLGRRRS